MKLSLNCDQILNKIDSIFKELQTMKTLENISSYIKEIDILNSIFIDGYSLMTALMSINGDDRIYEYMKKLVEKGMDVNRKDNNKNTIFNVYLEDYNNYKKLEFLVSHNFIIDYKMLLMCDKKDIKSKILDLLIRNYKGTFWSELEAIFIDILYTRYIINNKDKIGNLIEYILEKYVHRGTYYRLCLTNRLILNFIKNNHLFFLQKIFNNDRTIIVGNTVNIISLLKYMDTDCIVYYILEGNLNATFLDLIKELINNKLFDSSCRKKILENIHNLGKYKIDMLDILINFYKEITIDMEEFEALVFAVANYELEQYIDNLHDIIKNINISTSNGLPPIELVKSSFINNNKDNNWLKYLNTHYKNFTLSTYLHNQCYNIIRRNCGELLILYNDDGIFDEILNSKDSTITGILISIYNKNIQKTICDIIYNDYINKKSANAAHYNNIISVYHSHNFIYKFCKKIPSFNIFDNIPYLHKQIKTILLIFKYGALNREKENITLLDIVLCHMFGVINYITELKKCLMVNLDKLDLFTKGCTILAAPSNSVKGGFLIGQDNKSYSSMLIQPGSTPKHFIFFIPLIVLNLVILIIRVN